jgi:hypothetical protein
LVEPVEFEGVWKGALYLVSQERPGVAGLVIDERFSAELLSGAASTASVATLSEDERVRGLSDELEETGSLNCR